MGTSDNAKVGIIGISGIAVVFGFGGFKRDRISGDRGDFEEFVITYIAIGGAGTLEIDE